MPIVLDKPIIRVVDMTTELNDSDTTEKSVAASLIGRFDIEYTEDRDKVKHYPLDDLITEDELAEQGFEAKLKNLSTALWLTFNYHVNKALEDNDKVLALDAHTFGEKPVVSKLGKIYTTKANRFGAKHSNEVKPYLFVYQGEHGKELMSEINFGIEIY